MFQGHGKGLPEAQAERQTPHITGKLRMIYQHRSITCRRGKLQKRTELFKATALKNFEDAGSPLIGSFETITGDDAYGICWQYRQFDSIDQWIRN